MIVTQFLSLSLFFAATQGPPSPTLPDWEPYRVFIGKWEGTGEGRRGQSKVTAEFEFILNSVFLQVKGRAVYESTPEKPGGEVHQDLGLFNVDMRAATIVLRYYQDEGLIYHYRLVERSPDKKRFVFETERIDGVPDGFRARTIFTVINNDEFLINLDVARGSDEFVPYSQEHYRRKKK